MKKKIDSLYAALMLIEILYERGLINKATLDAVREKVVYFAHRGHGKKDYGYDDEVECDRGGTSPQERNPDGVRRNPILGILALCAAASDCVEHLHLHFIWRKGQLDFPGNRFCLCRPNRRNPYRHERRGTLVPYRCTDGVSGSLDKKISSITTSSPYVQKPPWPYRVGAKEVLRFTRIGLAGMCAFPHGQDPGPDTSRQKSLSRCRRPPFRP